MKNSNRNEPNAGHGESLQSDPAGTRISLSTRLIVGIQVGVTYLAGCTGFFLHWQIIKMAYKAEGMIWAVVTTITPPFSEIYWLFRHGNEVGWWNSFSQLAVVEICLGIVYMIVSAIRYRMTGDWEE